MPTSLEALRLKLDLRLRVLDAGFERHRFTKASMMSLDRFSRQEGLVSLLWQAWCGFCRATLIQSATGAVSSSGVPVTSPYAGRSDLEIAYVAKRLSLNQVVAQIQSLAGSHLEPTWGDLIKLNRIAGGLHTTNGATLLSSFGSAVAVSDLQLCRNAAAHLNADRIDDVKSAKVRYSQTAFRHPSDMMLWIEPTTQDFAWKVWLAEIRTVASLAVA